MALAETIRVGSLVHSAGTGLSGAVLAQPAHLPDGGSSPGVGPRPPSAPGLWTH